MPKAILKVKFTGRPVGITKSNEQYLVEDIEYLRSKGADDLMQLDVLYKEEKFSVKGVVGIAQGRLMSSTEDYIALPCPPYCHPNTDGVNREQGELTFQEALEKIKS